MEDDLRESNDRYRILFEQSPDGIVLLDSEGTMVEFNETAHKQLGYTHQEFERIRVSDIDPVESPEEIRANIKRVSELGRAEFDVKHRTKQGEVREVHIISQAIQLSGRPFVYAIWRDITDIHLLEEERMKTQKLESIGTLAGGIAHDFNNLLQGIFGYIAMARLTHDRKEKSFAMLDQAEKALHMSVNLTAQLLTFAKGGKPLKKLIRVEPLVENAVRFSLSGSGTVHDITASPGLRSVEADEAQLTQVIKNIVLNASEAMAGKGSVQIRLDNLDLPRAAVAQLPDGGAFVTISIEDSGVGIDEQNLSKIFDPYFTTKQRGSGMGLATAYSIIKNHNGAIAVKSEPQRGTTFTIYLPASKEKACGPRASGAAPSPARQLKVLLMDDEAIVRNVALEMIGSFGHEAVGAEDGRRALELFREARAAGRPFDLVIFDLTVKGGMGGEEAIARLREMDSTVRTVVSSGYADSPVVANYGAYGFSAVLSKPYSLAALRGCFELLFSEEPGGRP